MLKIKCTLLQSTLPFSLRFTNDYCSKTVPGRTAEKYWKLYILSTAIYFPFDEGFPVNAAAIFFAAFSGQQISVSACQRLLDICKMFVYLWLSQSILNYLISLIIISIGLFNCTASKGYRCQFMAAWLAAENKRSNKTRLSSYTIVMLVPQLH